MSFEFNAENKKVFESLLTKYPNKQAALLPALWIAQKQDGYLSLEAQECIAHLLDVSPAHVQGVVSFYTMFRQKPVGKFHLQVCHTLSCALGGCEKIIQHLDDKYKLRPGETSEDGQFSLELMECLASCGTGPAMMVNESYVENLTTEKVDQLIEKLAKE